MSNNRYHGKYDSIELATADIKERALKRIKKLYGPDGQNTKAYHNLDHTLAVIDAAERIAQLGLSRKLIVPERDIHLVTIAAVWHDGRHSRRHGAGYNEYVSAQMAARAMQETGVFSQRETKAVQGMIKGTEVKFVDGKVIQQANPKNYLQKVIADADLSNLGQPFDFYWQTAEKVYEEVMGEPGSEQAIAKMSLGFITGHEFLTDEAVELFPHQDENIAELEKLVS